MLVGDFGRSLPVIQPPAIPALGLEGKSSVRGDFLLFSELSPVTEPQTGLADLNFCKLLPEAPSSQALGSISPQPTVMGNSCPPLPGDDN